MRTSASTTAPREDALQTQAKGNSSHGGIADLRSRDSVRSGLQQAVDGSQRMAQLKSMQNLANAGRGSAVVQLKGEEPDLQEPDLGDVEQEQYDAVEGTRGDMRSDVGHMLIGAKVVPEPKAPTGFWAFVTRAKAPAPGELKESRAFENTAWEVIDALLPQLMNDIPFENTLAAIRFAQDIFKKMLREQPALIHEAKLKELLEQHLEAVIAKLPIDPHATEEDDDDDGAEKDKKKARTSDKRFVAAKARVTEQRRTEDEAAPEPMANKKSAEYGEEMNKLYSDELKVFEQRYSLIHGASAKLIAARIGGAKGEVGYRLLKLLNGGRAGDGPNFIRHLNQIYNKSFAGTYTTRRIEDADAFEHLNLLTSPQEKQAFISGAETGQAPSMVVFEQQLDTRLKQQRDKLRELRESDSKATKEVDARNTAKREDAHQKALIAAPSDVLDVLKKIDPDVVKPTRAAIQLLQAATSAHVNGVKDRQLLEAYEDYFARRGMPPSNDMDNPRVKAVDALEEAGLLPGVDAELLKSGTRSGKAVVEEAVRDSWATKEEIALCSRLLGTSAFVGILDSHMRRQKPGPLRAMIEQLKGQSTELLKNAPPLKSTSLILDTNMIDLLKADPASLSDERKPLRHQLNALIADHGITDIRLANMNVAELSGVERMVGQTVSVSLNPDKDGAAKTVKLMVLGVPYHGGRGSGKYAELFQKLEDKKVGENKGNADRSMMADILMAERERGPGGLAVPHFATADMGVARELGVDETTDRKFGAANLGMAPQRGIGQAELHSFDQAGVAKSSAASGGVAPVVPGHGGGQGKHKIWDFPIGDKHRVSDITALIKKSGFEVLVVGGAVRDLVRRAPSINDVDMKTDMPAVDLEKLMKANGLQASLTEAINLVTVGSDEQSADIVSTSLNGPKVAIDRRKDAATRDFTLNTMYLDPSLSAGKRDLPMSLPPSGKDGEDSLARGHEHAASGLLHFSADPGGPDFAVRAKAILQHLKEKPENFGRALKFLQRGYKSWIADFEKYRKDKADYDLNKQKRSKRSKRSKQPPQPVFRDKGYYHMEAAVLDMLRANAVHVLAPLLDSQEMGPHKKGLFIHQSGFKTPMEMVAVMRRLNFPPEAIQMVYPDTLAGRFENRQQAWSREIAPRLRSTGPVSAWDPAAAPVVKVDAATGKIYQYRTYAYAEVKGVEEKLLLDVDYSDHGVAGHSAPHYHVYRAVNDKWTKTASNLSRTGQPGEPPVSMVKGRRHYTGPHMWTWWAPAGKVGDQPDDLRKELEEAGARANIPIGKGDPVDIGGQVTLPMARLRELYNNGRMPMLLQLVHNLRSGQDWNPHDDSVVELTGSKDGRERLRFQPQLRQVRTFLQQVCHIEKPDSLKTGGPLNDEELARLADLANAGYSPESCGAAARYAQSKLGSHPNVADFVNYFEYYMAATENKVARADMDLLHQRTVTHTGAILSGSRHQLAGGSDHEPQLRAGADHLRFGNANTAAYHLHKHLDMVDIAPDQMGVNKHMKTAANSYIELARDTVKTGVLKKTVTETVSTVKYYYEKGEVVAIVEVDTVAHQAQLLTCYHTGGEAAVFLTSAESAPVPKQGKDSKPVPHDPNLPLQYYRTPFGTFGRLQTNNDGNCFFHAVRRSAGLAQGAPQLRADAVNELRTNYARSFNGTRYTDFIDRQGTPLQVATAAADYLARNGAWAENDGDLVPELMARALGRTIHILSRSNGSLVETVGPPNSNPIVIFYNGGTHYEASQPVG